MKENKQYKLKRWYPSLKKTVEVGCIITKIYTCGGYHYRGSDNEGVIFYVSGSQCENNPDFWELIEEKKPLFITEDGVEVLSDIDNLYAVNLTYFNKTKNTLRHSSWLIENSAYKVFYHEANADEYIWRNMRLFSYEDVVEWYGYGFKLGREGIYETLERLAIERSRNE